ncbi:hypothetical protein BJX68DRAFT_229363 [Aspergillus pseudodeflectus]|uniref:Secreted protein n=1 Tax=Aspergillus pseudodeflectus TaxID=176178 RepID=A0ABR4KWP2_9EURO
MMLMIVFCSVSIFRVSSARRRLSVSGSTRHTVSLSLHLWHGIPPEHLVLFCWHAEHALELFFLLTMGLEAGEAGDEVAGARGLDSAQT